MTDGLGPVAHRFQSQRLTLNYLDWGNADAPLLLLVHGGEDHARSWDWVAERLRDDWHVVCPDLRGHGDSDWSPDGVYTMEYLATDLANLIAHLDGKDVSIVAHSYGGAVSLRYAGLFPETVRRLAVIEGLASMDDFRRMHAMPDEDAMALWRKWIENRRVMSGKVPRYYPTIAEAVARMKARNPHLTDAQADHLAFWGMKRRESGDYGWKFDPYIRAQQPWDPTDKDRQAIWGAITCPTLLFHGKESWASNPAEDGRADMFQNARVISMERAGHWVQHDRLDDFVSELKAFL
jgi:pimeloyl-ACP methyl ester carboxylesterase